MKHTPDLLIEIVTTFNTSFREYYNATAISIDVALLPKQDLNFLKSFTIIANGPPEEFFITMKSAFEISINPQKQKEMFEMELNGVIEEGNLLGDLRGYHKHLSVNIIKYMGWRKGLTIDETGTKPVSLDAVLYFNGSKRVISLKGFYDVIDVSSYVVVDFETVDLTIDINRFCDLYSKGSGVPLYHELLTEASSLMSTLKRRSAYLVLYSALEIATKEFIKTMKPDTDYLIDKMQSPELSTLYSRYINVKISTVLGKEDIKKVKAMSEKRNNIAHKGDSISYAELKLAFNFAKSVIRKIEIIEENK